MTNHTSHATLASGCFWCTEGIFQRIKGVTKVTSGYSGGIIDNPTYEQVSSGNTGHAEAVQIEFDPTEIAYETILEIFFKTHDPTTLNRQGNDIGTQYRSAIFYHNEDQKQIAQEVIRTLDETHYFPNPIVTEVTKYTNFYTAENYHQNFYNSNPTYPYCQIIIDPKIKKLLSQFSDKISQNA